MLFYRLTDIIFLCIIIFDKVERWSKCFATTAEKNLATKR